MREKEILAEELAAASRLAATTGGAAAKNEFDALRTQAAAHAEEVATLRSSLSEAKRRAEAATALSAASGPLAGAAAASAAAASKRVSARAAEAEAEVAALRVELEQLRGKVGRAGEDGAAEALVSGLRGDVGSLAAAKAELEVALDVERSAAARLRVELSAATERAEMAEKAKLKAQADASAIAIAIATPDAKVSGGGGGSRGRTFSERAAESARSGVRAAAVDVSDGEGGSSSSGAASDSMAGSSDDESNNTKGAAAAAAGGDDDDRKSSTSGLFSRGRAALRSLSTKKTDDDASAASSSKGGSKKWTAGLSKKGKTPARPAFDDVDAKMPGFVAKQVSQAFEIYGPLTDVGGFMASLGYEEFSGPTPRGAARAVFEDALHATRAGANPYWSMWDSQIATAAHSLLTEWRDSYAASGTPRA